MYLYLGGEHAVRSSSIIGIFDMDTATQMPSTKKFLIRAEKSGNLFPTNDIPRAFVITGDSGVYLSQVSPVSLKKRLSG